MAAPVPSTTLHTLSSPREGSDSFYRADPTGWLRALAHSHSQPCCCPGSIMMEVPKVAVSCAALSLAPGRGDESWCGGGGGWWTQKMTRVFFVYSLCSTIFYSQYDTSAIRFSSHGTVRTSHAVAASSNRTCSCILLVLCGLPDLNVALAHRNQLWMHAIDMEVLHLIPLVVGAEVDEGTVGAGVGRAVMLHRAHQMVLF